MLVGEMKKLDVVVSLLSDLSLMNTCLKSPCNITGALCINTPNGPRCVCADDALENGTRCVYSPLPLDPCSGYCGNGGTCNRTELGQAKCR